mgnify:CR=1 FL=1
MIQSWQININYPSNFVNQPWSLYKHKKNNTPLSLEY